MSLSAPRFRRVRQAATVGIVLATLAVFAIPTHALTGSNFESTDANLVVNTAGNKDWANAPALQTQTDLPSGQTDDSFQSSDEDDPNPQIGFGSIPPRKSDLARFYVSSEHVGTTDFLYVAWVRTNILGTANMGFELNQAETQSDNGVTPDRSEGDALITFDWDSGGNTVNLGLLRWVTTGADSQCEANPSVPCWGNRVDLTAAGFADGAVNDGFSVTDPIAGGTIGTRRFGEAAVNLNASGILPPGSCIGFASTYLKSRSSTAFNSALKDFIRPKSTPISTCGEVRIHKQDDAGNPLQGAGFTLFTDAAPLGGSPPHGAEDTATSFTCSTDAAGNCTIEDVPLGRYWIVETTVPPNHDPAADRNITLTTGGQVVSVTLVDPRQPGRINIHKQDDAGAPLPGATFTLFDDNAPIDANEQPPRGAEDTAHSPTLACTTNAAGNCSIQNVPLGRYWVVETVTPPGYFTAADKYANLDTAAEIIGLTFTNPPKFVVIVVVCKQASNTLHQSTVTIDGVNKQSLATGGGGALTDAQVCGLGGARYTDKATGNHPGNVNIP